MGWKGLAGVGFGLALVACTDGSTVDGGAGADESTGSTSTGSLDSSEGGPGPGTTGMTGTTSTTGSVDGTGTSMGDETSTGEGSESSTGGEPPSTFEECFEGQFVNEATVLPDYDQYEPVIGSHCVGTNHQDIEGIERVVFLGDSITVGSRPTLPGDVYRARLGDMLRDAYGLSYGDAISEALWKAPNPFSGEVAQMTAGDFTSCSRWGARNDDLPVGVGNQLEDCFGPQTLDQRTLVVMTSGGNDVSALAQDAIDGVPLPDLWMAAEDFVMLKREAVEWITAPGRFTSGVFVVFANIYEFTDGTGDVMSCDVSGLAGFDQPVPNPMELTELVVWANEQYMSIAVDTGTDMQFLLETFCGHGFANDDPTSPCYRGPGTPRWFDLTCIHPNPEGHGVIADQFMAIIEE